MLQNLEYPSHDGRTTIHAVLWRDEANESPRGIVQLVHGMAEYIERYDEFARYLVDAGYVVCGHDHIGHGQSVVSKEDWGVLPLDGGADILIEDVHELRLAVQPCFPPETPYFIFGHSMGSFVVRNYVAKHGEGLAGAIICGTGHVDAKTAAGGRTLARVLSKLRGPRYVSTMMHNMSVGAYSKAIKNAATPVDWLSHNADNVKRYLEDEACGFLFSVSGNAALMDLLVRLADGTWAQRTPKELPLLFIAGSEDPVGDNGAGVQTAYEHTTAAGMPHTQIVLYDNMRHEILNEDDRERVFADIATWLESVLTQA